MLSDWSPVGTEGLCSSQWPRAADITAMMPCVSGPTATPRAAVPKWGSFAFQETLDNVEIFVVGTTERSNGL